MKITDEMVFCPVCGWMRNHTSLSWSKWARLLTCWNNHSESESPWMLWVFFHRTVLMYYNHPLPFNAKKARKNKVELLLTMSLTPPPPIYLFFILENVMRGDWIEKGRGKVQWKTPDGENIAWWQIKIKIGHVPAVRGWGVHELFSSPWNMCLQKCIVMGLNMCNTIKPCDAEVSGWTSASSRLPITK